MICIGRYELRTIIGRGGMAEVWDGYDVRLDRAVAVKVLRAELAQDAELRRRFEFEASVAARVSHPNVVVLFDTGEEAGVPYLVMERLPGRTLADEIIAGPLPIDRARRVAGEVLAGLDAAHAVGVLHRDVKPSNVLLSAEGGAKVADFGIAKVAEAADITRTGLLLGTPSYVAPERIAGGPATVATDVYAVGVLLYEALTGRKPFNADTPIALLHAIAEGKATQVEVLRPDVDPRLAEVVERAMAVDPARRYPSAAAMAAALAPNGDDRHSPPVDTTVRMAEPTVVDIAPADGPMPVGRMQPDRRAVTTRVFAAGAGCLLLVVVVLLVLGSRSTSTGSATTTSSSTSSTIPPALSKALEHLDKATRP